MSAQGWNSPGRTMNRMLPLRWLGALRTKLVVNRSPEVNCE